MKKNKFNLKREYKESWNYIKESKNFIYSIIGVFFGFTLIGFFVPASEEITKIILEFIEKLLEQTKDMSQLELIRFIFVNNLQSSFFGLIFGVALGIFPVLAAVANGYVLGFVGAISVETEGIFVLWRIFPHGIFELPAIFISLGLGLKLGSFIFRKEKGKFFRRCFWNSLRVFLFVVIPLLIIAAIIEASLIFLG
ncbi:stage II sporulation protein M [Candidatus Pacearchaeota archaeon]|nr:stage II sporulation protein M [Candidatus Pacearchaeota archaeon]